MDPERMKEQIAVAFEYAYDHDDWVAPLDEALEGVTAAQALRRPNGAVRCIWEIVLHLAVWNENIIERTRTRQKARPAEGAWPELPAHLDEAAWRQAQDRLRKSLTDLRSFIAASTLDELDAGPYGLGDLLCRFTHIAYHLGQITKLREAIDPGTPSHARRQNKDHD